ncbi:hypothetical protein [Nocardia fluminea]|uniref:hypothetical protein n=1 Tax=Nocardia fluminea TaxID=134984 RepID=UPI0033FAE9FA
MQTMLKMLLAERQLKTHSDFMVAYDRCAAQLDPPVPPGYGPAKAQYYQWLSGRMVGLPRDYHRRVLERMFPGWSIERLFQIVDSPAADERAFQPSSPIDSKLAAFLGADMVARGVTLVYPTRRDAVVVVPENDLRGLLYVSALLQHHTGIRVDFCGDGEAAAYTDRAYIGFGLGTVPSPPGGATRRLFTVSTTDPTIGPVVEHLELSDGTRYDSNGKHHIGFLARIRPSPGLHPDRYWFLCAGLAPRGAAGAGWFLANHWSSLHQWAGANEFVAVLAIRRYSDQTSGLKKLIVGSPDAESREQPSTGSGD